MNQQNYQQQPYGNQPNYFGYQVDLPNATGVLVLGILSIVFAGIIGIILASIGLSMAAKARAEYHGNPGKYTESSYSRVNAGRICSIIGVVLSVIGVLFVFSLLSRF